jgi:hypothetical protein
VRKKLGGASCTFFLDGLPGRGRIAAKAGKSLNFTRTARLVQFLPADLQDFCENPLIFLRSIEGKKFTIKKKVKIGKAILHFPPFSQEFTRHPSAAADSATRTPDSPTTGLSGTLKQRLASREPGSSSALNPAR